LVLFCPSTTPDLPLCVVQPFTLYGTTLKQYSREVLDGDKVVSRLRGFTVETCVGAIDASQEGPQFQGLPSGGKVRGGTSLHLS